MTHEIDWANAPEGAMYYCSETDKSHAAFYTDDFKRVWVEQWPKLGWQEAHQMNERDLPIPRPTSTGIPELKKLTQAVFKDAPAWAKWSVVTGFGDAYLSEDEPSLVMSDEDRTFYWEAIFSQQQRAGSGFDASGWQNSKIERQESITDVAQIDVYSVLRLFEVTDPCLQHIVKKALCAGKRGAKDFAKDVQEIADTANRLIEMEQGK